MVDMKNSFRKLICCDLGLIDYQEAWDLQKEFHQQRSDDNISDIIFLLEHPNTYTLGKTAHKENLIGDQKFLTQNNISVYEIDRGGDITYHGPGQLVGYPIINLNEWQKDTHKYLRSLEDVIINICNDYGLKAGRIEHLTGVWIDERKIAAIGIKVSRWITMHGFAFNINTDLKLFNGIIPCGITDKAVTSLNKELSINEISISIIKDKVIKHFKNIFNYDTVEFRTKDEILNLVL